MISLKKDYEQHVKLINEQLLSYQRNKLATVPMRMSTTSQCCQGASHSCIVLYF